jgi:hypothetical protein
VERMDRKWKAHYCLSGELDDGGMRFESHGVEARHSMIPKSFVSMERLGRAFMNTEAVERMA